MNANKKSLIIVESPSKAKTINKFLGDQFKVTASIGHIIDLPKSRLGVDIDQGFKPEYIRIRGKEKIIKELKKTAGNFEKVYLATDPDREGEAIAYHISTVINGDKQDVKRIIFNEITKSAILKSLMNPYEIDMAKVYSQQARRVLDRIVGYKVSPVLWKTIYRGLSAGRVQSVALRLICEREQEIRSFDPEEYWTIRILVEGEAGEPFWAKLVKVRDPKNSKFEKVAIKSEEVAKAHLEKIKRAKFLIDSLERQRVKKGAAPPFITSTLQQAAARIFRYSTSRIMRVAQKLYEGIDLPGKGSVGLITYMRTDSTRISADAITAVRGLIQNKFGMDYLPYKVIIYRSKKSAQDAHEAIRPTYFSKEYHPDIIKNHLSSDEYKIYDLIWKRFLACQMNPAIFDKTVVDILGDDYLFKAEGEVLIFDGYLKVYGASLEKPNENNAEGMVTIPSGIREKEHLSLNQVEPKQNFTKPPARYSESTLVKELDNQGIGRPSTYAQIITTILNRKYIEKIENKLHATELGETVNQILISNFPNIFNVKFTAEMEEELDKIAANTSTYIDTMNNFYLPFIQSMEKVDSLKERIKSDLQKQTDITCDLCGKPMVIRWGRNGRFMACTGYPNCKNTRPLEEITPEFSDEVCDKCGNKMVIKTGRFGKFLACSNYPECKNTKPIPSGIKCPKENCNGDVIIRKTKKGRTFYGCSKYPACNFLSWFKPVNQICSSCGNKYLVEKISKTRGNFLQCPECNNKYK
jgi:DNA topoisomerase-1